MIDGFRLDRPILLSTAAVLLTVPSALAAGEAVESPMGPVRQAVYWSEELPVDRIYRSMQGPDNVKTVHLTGADRPEVFWVTGYRADIVDSADESIKSSEYMCHNVLELNDMGSLGEGRTGHRRLFTLSQGQMEVAFPEGFGIPVTSTEELSLWSQVLNLNPLGEHFTARHRVAIHYIRDRELVRPMIPLFERPVEGMVVVPILPPEDAGGAVGKASPDETSEPGQHGASCSVGLPASALAPLIRDGKMTFTSHWVVPPGREERHTLVTQSLRLPFDTTIHYIAVHVHAFAESLELRDLTTDESLFKSRMQGRDGRIGIERLESFSSAAGIPVYKDHEYELVSIYDNTSDEDQDAMAVLLLYMRDHPERSAAEVRRALTRVVGRGAAPPPWALWSIALLSMLVATLASGWLRARRRSLG